jgi:putative ATPase
LQIALSVKDAVDFVGLPEGIIPLAQGVTYLAGAPKSNASYRAMIAAREDARKLGTLPVPLHLRNAATPLMRKLGYGEDYLYPHDFDGAVTDQSYLPEQIEGRTYYTPSDRGYEARMREYLDRVRRMRSAARESATQPIQKKH